MASDLIPEIVSVIPTGPLSGSVKRFLELFLMTLTHLGSLLITSNSYRYQC